MSADAKARKEAANSAPLLRVVRGNPSDEELAALVLLVAALGPQGGDGGGVMVESPHRPWVRRPRRLPAPVSWRWSFGP